MHVRMGLLRKQAGWTPQAFDAWWHDRHGPLAAQVPHLRAYWQNLVIDRLQRGIDFPRGPWDFDGFSQLWFDDIAQADAGFGRGDLAARLIADENHFLGGLHIVTAEQSVVIALPQEAARSQLLKRISIIKRRPDIGPEAFRHEWRAHADLVRQMPGVSGYRQNVVVARERVKGTACGYDALPIDGIVELWFQDTATLEAAFGAPAGRATMQHAQSFLDEITAFVVHERRIV